MAPLLVVLAGSAPGVLGLAQQGAQQAVYVANPNAPLRADGSLDVAAARQQGLAVATTGQIDTGSTITGVADSLLRAVGAQPTGAPPESYSTPAGVQTTGLYRAWVTLPSGYVLNKGLTTGVLDESLVAPVQVLVGDDVLSQFDFSYRGRAGSWSLTEPGAGPTANATPWLIAGGALVLAGSGWLIARREHRELRQLRRAA